MGGKVTPVLPRELLLDVLSRLPWVSNLRFRTVCKSWNSILKSPEIVNSMRVRSVNQGHPPCIVSTDGYTVYVNISLNECGSWDSNVLPWRQLPLGFPTACPLKVVVEAFGYFLVRSHLDLDEQGQYMYFLFDPLLKVLRKVPPVPPPSLEGVFKPTRYVEAFPLDGPESDDACSEAKLILLERFSVRQVDYRRIENWRVYCYDAVSEKLDLISDASQPPLQMYRLSNGDNATREEVKARFLKVRNVTVVGQTVYILARPDHAKECSHNAPSAERCMDHRYGHVLLMALQNRLVDMPFSILNAAPFAQLFQHRGHLHLAFGKRTFVVGAWRRSILPFEVEIWKHSMGYWNRIAAMPEDLVDELLKKMIKGELFRVDTEGDYVCFSRWMDSELFIFYNLETRSWKLVKLPDLRPGESGCETEKETIRNATAITGQHTEQMMQNLKGSNKKCRFRSYLWQPKLFSK